MTSSLPTIKQFILFQKKYKQENKIKTQQFNSPSEIVCFSRDLLRLPCTLYPRTIYTHVPFVSISHIYTYNFPAKIIGFVQIHQSEKSHECRKSYTQSQNTRYNAFSQTGFVTHYTVIMKTFPNKSIASCRQENFHRIESNRIIIG